MRFGSVCSGIEAASVAWNPLGWKAAWVSEVDKFPSAVIKHHYPDVPNHGDMTALPARILRCDVEAPTILCGGTPCQAFSLAGKRESMADSRGNLSLTFTEIADAIDIVRQQRGEQPSIIFWENVVGSLSTKDNFFGCFLAKLSGADEALLPFGKRWENFGVVFGEKRTVAWRVLNSEHFGIPQRRRRVYLCASARDARDFSPIRALFEQKSLCGDFAEGADAPITEREVVGCLTTRTGNANDNYSAEVGHCLVTNGKPRWITPIECERIMGFEDNYTNIPWKNKATSPKSLRYKALGNSWAVPVVRWIGERINKEVHR